MKYIADASEEKGREENVDMSRRKALGRLGLMAVVTYTAPLLLKISDAHAEGGSSGGSGGSSGGSGGSSAGGSSASGATSATGATGTSGTIYIPDGNQG